jgi:hypothetical protein
MVIPGGRLRSEIKISKKMKLLELFAGSRCFGSAAEKLGYTIFSIDWEQYEGIDLSIDIEFLQSEQVPFIPDHVHASFDCTTYTIAAISTHRNGTEPKSEYAKKCDRVNQHVIELIKYWQTINPNLTFTFENPRGMLRHMPFMQQFKRHTVWYCQYGDDRAKPTDIWTNIESWKPKPMCSNFKYDKQGNIINRHCHHQSARRGAKTGTQGRNGSYERSKIPDELCREILKAVTPTPSSPKKVDYKP